MSNNEDEFIQVTGIVTETVRGAFIVKLDNSDHVVNCRLAGKMRSKENDRRVVIRVVVGDHVTVQVSPYDLSRGRIVYRDNNDKDKEKEANKGKKNKNNNKNKRKGKNY